MFDRARNRGLAVSAVSALAISGLTVISSPALAAPGDAVTMLSQRDGKASVRPDGADRGAQYVDVVAVRRDPDATISFEVNIDPAAGDTSAGWTAIEHEPTLTGDFAKASWDALSAVGNTVSLRAVATTDEGTEYSTVNGVAVTGIPEAEASEPHSVSVVDGLRGYFPQPYADSNRTASQLFVAGSSSAVEGTVELSWWRSSDGTFQGSTDAALSESSYKVTIPGSEQVSYDIGVFSQVLDITGYDAEASGGVIAVRGVRDSDEVTPIEVYEQDPGAVTATASGPNSRMQRVLIRVADAQQGVAVAGAEVRKLSDGSLVGYTDVDGSVAVKQAAETTESYYVNVTDSDAYQSDIDLVTEEFTTPEFVPAVSGIVADLADGDYFDDDEYGDGDIALQLVDQDGEPIASEGDQIAYVLSEDGSTPPEPTVAASDADGRLAVPFDPAGPDGKYVLEYSAPDVESGGSTEFTTGDATLTLTPDEAGKSVSSGGQLTYTGNLDLDGVPLAGRSIDLAYTRGVEEAPGTEADAGIVVGDTRVLSTTVKTDEDGDFSVTVADPAETGRPAETGGILTATAPAAQETASATTTFTAGPVVPTPPSVTPPKTPAKVKLKLTGSSKGRAADKLKVAGAKTAAGQRVRVFAKVGKGGWKLVTTRRLDSTGRANVQLKDRNGRNVTGYRVELTASDAVASSTSNVKRLR